ncbi:hypothetical protein FACS189499_06910 [Clostridia bacterium]|nr:hypothetical protein FACS189499_06910 [Clostridia bacterium]
MKKFVKKHKYISLQISATLSVLFSILLCALYHEFFFVSVYYDGWGALGNQIEAAVNYVIFISIFNILIIFVIMMLIYKGEIAKGFIKLLLTPMFLIAVVTFIWITSQL